MLFLPQTPQFLMIQKKEKEAEGVLKRCRLTTNARQTLMDIRLAISEQDSQTGLCSGENYLNGRMLIAIGLVVAQQVTGLS